MPVNHSSSRGAARSTIAAAALLWMALPAPVAAQATVQNAAKLELAALDLPSGRGLWSDADPGTGPVAIVISLPSQVAYVYRGATLIGVASVSTGKSGKETPTGSFEILQKRVFHRSNLYSNAPMPFMQRLTWDGIALHAGDNPGYPASHGCIRFPAAFAKKLFNLTSMGGAVAITDDVAVVPPGAKVPRLLPPRDSFSFGSEPVIASRTAVIPPIAFTTPNPVPASGGVARTAPVPRAPTPRPIGNPVTAAQADTAPRIVAIGFEPVRR